jgi:hypothetical protein
MGFDCAKCSGITMTSPKMMSFEVAFDLWLFSLSDLGGGRFD